MGTLSLIRKVGERIFFGDDDDLTIVELVNINHKEIIVLIDDKKTICVPLRGEFSIDCMGRKINIMADVNLYMFRKRPELSALFRIDARNNIPIWREEIYKGVKKDYGNVISNKRIKEMKNGNTEEAKRKAT